jgi:MFS family permease
MKVKFYLLATLLGGIVIFVWSAFAHMAIPGWESVMHELPNEQAVVDAMKSAGVQNGMYYGTQGVFLVTFFGQGMADGVGMSSYMILEFISDALLALVLAWLLTHSHARGTSKFAFFAVMVGLTGWLNVNLSNWNWYHFPFGYVLMEALDQIVGLFLAGLLIGWLIKRERTSITVEPTRARAVG